MYFIWDHNLKMCQRSIFSYPIKSNIYFKDCNFNVVDKTYFYPYPLHGAEVTVSKPIQNLFARFSILYLMRKVNNYFYKLDCVFKVTIKPDQYLLQSIMLCSFKKYSMYVLINTKKCFLKGRNRALWSWNIPTTITFRWNSITTKTKYLYCLYQFQILILITACVC